MSDFDPYHVWLGIPPEEQPPNHYRLLGITKFERQPDVIASAADRQMGHLRTFQSGKNSTLSQRILNEVAAAKLCLLNSAKKAVYDEQLRRSESPAVDTAVEQPISADVASSPHWTDIANYSPARTCPAKKRYTNLGPMIAIGATCVLMFLGLLAWNAARRSSSTQTIAQVEKQREQSTTFDAEQRVHRAIVKKNHRLESIPPSPPEPAAVVLEPASSSSPITPDLPQEPAIAKVDATVPTAMPTFEQPVDSPKKPTSLSFHLSNDKPADKPEQSSVEKKRLPVPDEEVQRKIAAQIGGIYNADHAKTPAEKIKLAYQLVQAAKASKEPNERYVLLSKGRTLAFQAGDAPLVFQVVELMADFDINVLDEKGKALLAFAERSNNAEQIRAIFNASQRMIVHALSVGRYELAAELADTMLRCCQRSKGGKEFRKKAFDQRVWVLEYCRQQKEHQQADAKLKTNPKDGEAHLTLGRYYCLDDDWKSGLPHLAKGSDSELCQLAEQDLVSPTKPAEQMKLADAWWELGKARQGNDRDLCLLRTGYWYDLARVKLSSGLDRLKAEKRLEELTEVCQRRAVARQRFHPGENASQDLWNDLF